MQLSFILNIVLGFLAFATVATSKSVIFSVRRFKCLEQHFRKKFSDALERVASVLLSHFLICY